jgi:transposase InsO family protein
VKQVSLATEIPDASVVRHDVTSFGETVVTAPHAIQWLSDNGQYTATASVLYAHGLGLVPITTPALPPGEQRTRGGLRAYVQTRLRERPRAAGRGERARPARGLDRRLNRLAPHSALGMRSPADYRALTSASRELTPPSV